MKPFLSVCCLLLIISCKPIDIKPQKPSFLIGNWIRVNNKDRLTTYETWQKDFSGIGLTLKGKDTTFFEKMEIINVNNALILEVSGVNETPTLFKFTHQSDTSFVCENPENEFPKKIKYWIDNELLKATISNADFKIEFIFEKAK